MIRGKEELQSSGSGLQVHALVSNQPAEYRLLRGLIAGYAGR